MFKVSTTVAKPPDSSSCPSREARTRCYFRGTLVFLNSNSASPNKLVLCAYIQKIQLNFNICLTFFFLVTEYESEKTYLKTPYK